MNAPRERETLERIALGTVQFGLPYGVANQTGQVAFEEVREILQYSESVGIDTLDTAMAYGESEQRLGTIGVDQWRVISKLPSLPDDCADVMAWVQDSVGQTLQRLRSPRLYGLLLHRPLQLLGKQGDKLHCALRQVVTDGLVQKTGVSIYSPEELAPLCTRFQFDIVQAPLNILDRRLIDSGWLGRLMDQGTEVHARSIFLQGLLLMKQGERPDSFLRWHALWARWHTWLGEAKITPLEACIGYVLSLPEISRVIVGVDSLTQLRQTIQATGGLVTAIPAELSCNDPDLLNPSRWSSL